MISLNKLSNLLIFLYIVIYFLGQALGNALIISLSPIFGIFAFFFLNKKFKQRNVLLTILLLFFLSFYILVNHHYPFDRLVFNLIFIATNILLAFNVNSNNINIKLLLVYILSLLYSFFFICLIISLTQHETVYNYIDTILVGFSYNYVSGYLILATSLLMAVNYLEYENKVSDFVMTLFVILLLSSCFLLYGRSGIAFSFVLALIHFRHYWKLKNGLKTFCISMFIILLIGLLVQQSQFIINALYDSKFKEGLSSPRSIMFSEYIGALDIQSFISGVDMRTLPTIASFNINPHNSFINLHSMLGFVGIIILYGVIVRIVRVSMWKFSFGLCLLMYILRGALDTMIMPGVLDFIFLIVLTYPARIIRNQFPEEKKCTTT